MGDISVNKQVSFLAGDLLEPLDLQTTQFSLVMDLDSSCFNETEKTVPVVMENELRGKAFISKGQGVNA